MHRIVLLVVDISSDLEIAKTNREDRGLIYAYEKGRVPEKQNHRHISTLGEIIGYPFDLGP